jgi:hypothetical protein
MREMRNACDRLQSEIKMAEVDRKGVGYDVRHCTHLT